MDRLSALLQQFDLHGSVFFAGELCGSSAFEPLAGSGHIHLLRAGTVIVADAEGRTYRLDQPAVVFYPRPAKHHIRTLEGGKADVVCATVAFGSGLGNPLIDALPMPLCVPLHALPRGGDAVHLLFTEAFTDSCGQEATVNRLIEVVLIQFLRFVLDQGITDSGVLSALGDKHLAAVLVAIHSDPGHAWSLETLSQVAHMSRTRFALHFKKVLGCTPGDYLAQWRITVAQQAMRRGTPVAIAAAQVGYSNASALTRVFRKRLGLSPREWLAQGQRSPTQ